MCTVERWKLPYQSLISKVMLADKYRSGRWFPCSVVPGYSANEVAYKSDLRNGKVA